MGAEIDLNDIPGQFAVLLDEYAHLVDIAGHTVYRSTKEEAKKILASMPKPNQLALLNRLVTDVTVLQDAREAGEDLNDSKRLLWRFLKKMELTPCSDIFDRIKDGDVVELYGTEHVHLWQNMAFFDWCSISLERLYSDTWYQATERDPELTKELFGIANQILTGSEVKTVTPRPSWHSFQEVDTELNLKTEIHIKVMSPVVQNGKIVGIILVNECREAQ